MLLEKYLVANVPHADGDPGAGGGSTPPAAPPGSAAGTPAPPAAPGGAAAPWYGSGLDKDAVSYIEGKKFDGVGPLVKSAMTFEKLARDKNVMLKPDPAKLQEWDGYAELGWTPDAAKYQIEKPKPGNGQVLHEGLFTEFSKWAHELKVPPWQASALFNKIFSYGNEEIQRAETTAAGRIAEVEGTLRKEWGGDYEAKKTLASRAMRTIGIGEEDSNQLETVMKAPGLVRIFARLGEMLGEQQLAPAGGGIGLGARSPSAITSEIKKLEQDNIAIMKDQRHPLYSDITARRQKLIEELDRANRRAIRVEG